MAGALSGYVIQQYEASLGASTLESTMNTSYNKLQDGLAFNPSMHGSSNPTPSTSLHPPYAPPELQQKLAQKLGPEFVSTRPGPGGGPKLTYVEGWKVINLANEAFGFDGWSSSIIALTTEFMDFDETTRRYNVGVSAVVRVTLAGSQYAGTFHEDTGLGIFENAKSKGQALDKCKKEAVTDALKRSLRYFGNLMGNCLYDKGYTQEIVKIKVPNVKLEKSALHRRPEFAEASEERKPVISTNQDIKPAIPSNQDIKLSVLPRPPQPQPPPQQRQLPPKPAHQPSPAPPPAQQQASSRENQRPSILHPIPQQQQPLASTSTGAGLEPSTSTISPDYDDDFDFGSEDMFLACDEGIGLPILPDEPPDPDVDMSFDPPADVDRSVLGERLVTSREMPPPPPPIQPQAQKLTPEERLARQKRLMDAMNQNAKQPSESTSSAIFALSNAERSVAGVRLNAPSSSTLNDSEKSKNRLALIQQAMAEQARKQQDHQHLTSVPQVSQRRQDTATGSWSLPSHMVPGKRGADGASVARKPAPGMGLSAVPGGASREPLGTLSVDPDGNVAKRLKR